jgi:cbb3-type cytochrome oxidase subunit 1
VVTHFLLPVTFVVQRTCKTRLWGDKLALWTFLGYQAFILMAGLGYLAGVTQGKEYAEPEWYADLLAVPSLGSISDHFPDDT